MTEPAAADAFVHGLAGRRCELHRAGAGRTPVPVRRWRADAAGTDRWLLDACHGPTVDLGCGPGRLVGALTERGVPALGVDTSALAVRLSAGRGAVVLRRDLFDALPGEGRWHHALLADGNVGIGGDPVALLRRVRRLLAPGGSTLVELDRGYGLWRGRARLVVPGGSDGGWFPWALVGADTIAEVASAAGLWVRRMHSTRRRRRVFAELWNATRTGTEATGVTSAHPASPANGARTPTTKHCGH
ncbi:MAG: SAM-dependent methyltransferase [Pseudonocardia sp.]|nr:SAM-dependent methyltransferase [Pseudonocardia sp.]